MSESNREHKLRGTSAAKSMAKKESRGDRLGKLARAVGNDELKKRVANGNINRDMMMAMVCQHLRTCHELQQREKALIPRGSTFKWFRSVADHYKTWFTHPEPTAWHATAQAFKEAAYHLARGDVKRGKAELEKALIEEQRQMERLSALVDTKDMNDGGEAGWLGDIVDGGDLSGPCEMPADIALADEMLNIEVVVETMPNRRRRRDPWWTLEDDEEEEGENGAGP